MTDNRQTQEAATVREKSEFIKRIEDFANYMQKEYIDDCEGRSLLISAGDRSLGDSQGGMAHIMLGDRTMNTAGLASMMRQDGFDDVFRMARIVSTDDDGMGDVISNKRRRLRMLYGMAALSAFWTLCIVGFQIVGIGNWITTVSNLLLMAYIFFILCREILPLRRQVARLKAAEREEQEARKRRKMAALFFESLHHLMQRDDDDDDE